MLVLMPVFRVYNGPQGIVARIRLASRPRSRWPRISGRWLVRFRWATQSAVDALGRKVLWQRAWANLLVLSLPSSLCTFSEVLASASAVIMRSVQWLRVFGRCLVLRLVALFSARVNQGYRMWTAARRTLTSMHSPRAARFSAICHNYLSILSVLVVIRHTDCLYLHRSNTRTRDTRTTFSFILSVQK